MAGPPLCGETQRPASVPFDNLSFLDKLVSLGAAYVDSPFPEGQALHTADQKCMPRMSNSQTTHTTRVSKNNSSLISSKQNAHDGPLVPRARLCHAE